MGTALDAVAVADVAGSLRLNSTLGADSFDCSAQTQTRIGLLEEIPRSGSDSLPLLLGHLGIRAPYATRRKLRYEANQVWMNTTFISQGPQSWGKLAVET